jgi:hypothetical protein
MHRACVPIAKIQAGSFVSPLLTRTHPAAQVPNDSEVRSDSANRRGGIRTMERLGGACGAVLHEEARHDPSTSLRAGAGPYG